MALGDPVYRERHSGHIRRRRTGNVGGGIAARMAEETGLAIEVDRIVAAERELSLLAVRIAFLCRVVGGTFRPSVEVSGFRCFRPNQLPSGMRPLQVRIIKQALELRRMDMAWGRRINDV